MEPQQPISLGLLKKGEDNFIDDYKKNNKAVQGMLDQIFKLINTEDFINDMRSNPQHYFNFGFTFNDYKAYLMKIVYCRAVRKFIQNKRIQKIDQYNSNNQGTLGFGLQKYQEGGDRNM